MKIGKQIECPDCGKLFQSKDRLLQHLHSHALNPAGNHAFSCSYSADCKYKTNSKAYLNDHRRRMHKSDEGTGLWMCFVGSCREKPRSFLNNHQRLKHQQDHENVKCLECNQVFSAKRNMKRHVKRKHKAFDWSQCHKKLKWIQARRKFQSRGCWYWKCPIWNLQLGLLVQLTMFYIQHGILVQN